MGFLKWGAKKGSTGGTARKIFKQYQMAKENNPNTSEDELLYEIFINRFKNINLSEKEKQRLYFFVERKGPLNSSNFLNLPHLCYAIVEIETGIIPSDNKHYSIMTEVIDEELERLGYSQS